MPAEVVWMHPDSVCLLGSPMSRGAGIAYDISSWASKAGRSHWEEEKDISRVPVSVVYSACLGTLGNQAWLEDSGNEAIRGV